MSTNTDRNRLREALEAGLEAAITIHADVCEKYCGTRTIEQRMRREALENVELIRLELAALSQHQASAPAAPTAVSVNDESSAVDLWAEIWRLREAIKGPPGYASWQEAAIDERVRRVKAEQALSTAPAEQAPLGIAREQRHLLRCAIALLGRDDLSEVAGQSRAAVAHQLQVMLADSWDAEQAPHTKEGEDGNRPRGPRIEHLCRAICAYIDVNPDQVLDYADGKPCKLAWHRHDLQAARLLRELDSLAHAAPPEPSDAERIHWTAEVEDIADAIDTYIAGDVMPEWDNIKSWRNHLHLLIEEHRAARKGDTR